MANDLVPANNTVAPAVVDQRAILAALNLNPADPKTQALVLTCQRYNLDPLLKHALLIKGNLYITRDGLLHVAHATGLLDGIECDQLQETPSHFMAICTVYRKDMTRPFRFRGRYPKTGQMAKDYGPEMAEKVAECRALRHAFDVSLCSREELWDQAEDMPPVASPSNGNGSYANKRPNYDNAPQALPEAQPLPAAPQPRQLDPLQQAQLAYAEEADRLGHDVRSEKDKNKFAPTKFKNLFFLQTGHEEGSADDWDRARNLLARWRPADTVPPAQQGGYVTDHQPAPAQTTPGGTYKNIFPTPDVNARQPSGSNSITPMLPSDDSELDDPFAEEEKRATPYASASSDRGAF